MKRGNILWGGSLIVLGALFLLNRFYDFNLIRIANLWPFFILIPGLLFEANYFLSKGEPGLLVPGGILTTIGALFLFETISGWKFADKTWPVYPLAVAIGLFQLYIFGGRNKGLLIPVAILGGVSLTSFSVMLVGEFMSSILLPVLLILLGIFIVFKGSRK